jgi:hypothetical protein
MIRTLMVLVALLAATSSRANVLTEGDGQHVLAFEQRAFTIERDIIDTSRASSGITADCLQNLYGNLELTIYKIELVEVLASLSARMVHPTDEQTAITGLRIQIKEFLELLAINRGHINKIVGICASSGAVATKAQEVLRLFDEGTALVGAISKKIGPYQGGR